jgi:hypothetical protein
MVTAMTGIAIEERSSFRDRINLDFLFTGGVAACGTGEATGILALRPVLLD